MKKLPILLYIIFFFSSCEDFLKVEPQNEVSIAQQFSTLEGTKQALNGAYYATEAVCSDKYFVYADLLGGNLTFSPTRTGSNQGVISNSILFSNSYNFNDDALESDMSNFYADSYKVINNVNNILFYIDSLSEGTDDEKNQIRAEAFALRAFLHYNLLQVYSQTYNYTASASHLGIIYNTSRVIGGVDFPARKSVAESYELLFLDIESALTLFTNTSALSGTNYSFFTAVSTKAFAARAALQSNDWQKAVDYATDVITNSGVSLLTTNEYVSQWEQPNLPVSETLLEFSIPVDNEGEVGSSVSSNYEIFLNSSGVPTDYAKFVASQDIINLYEDNDVRKANFISVDLDASNEAGNQFQTFYFTKKFQDNAGTLNIRLSEMYLIRAEAHARLENSSNALSDLNTIRNRANTASITSTSNLLEEIFLERRRELAFEGQLFFDYARFNKNVERNLGCIATTCNLNYPNLKFVLPIPQNSINVNTNNTQNEGY